MMSKKPAKPKKPNLNKLCLRPEDPVGAGPDRPLCQRCGLFTGVRAAYVPAEWTKRLLIVDERPGRWQPVSKMLKLADRDIAQTYAVRCGGKAAPSMEQIKCCRPFLLHDINALAPETVLGLGNTALRALTNDGGATVTRSRGRLLEIPVDKEVPPKV